jgi:hypothetical protein
MGSNQRPMRSADLAFTVAVLCCALLRGMHTWAQDVSIYDRADLPAELRNGSATFDQVRQWAMHTYSDGSSPGNLDTKFDLDQDGRADLVAEVWGGGSGGAIRAAFLSTPSGYRYVGSWLGRIVPVSRSAGESPQLVIGSNNGSGCVVLQLVELRADSMHPVARSSLRAGDGGTAEGNRLSHALFGVPVAPASLVRQVFDHPTPMEALLSNIAARVPELTLADGPGEECDSAGAYYAAPGGAQDPASRVYIRITTYETAWNSANDIESIFAMRPDWGAPTRQETILGHTVYLWDATASRGNRLLAGAGTREIEVTSPRSEAQLAMKAIRVLLQQMEDADGK